MTKRPAVEPSEAHAQLLRCIHDPSWAAKEIDAGAQEVKRLRRMLELVIQQVDIGEDERTMKTFRGGTCMQEAREMLR